MFPKWKIFIWKVINNAIPTKQNLRRRHIDVSPACVFCGKEESLAHLFRDCELSMRVWKSCSLGINGLAAVETHVGSWVKNFLLYFLNQDGNSGHRVVFFSSILWSIWLHRNECVFKGTKASAVTVLELARQWMSRWEVSHCLNDKVRITTTSPNKA